MALTLIEEKSINALLVSMFNSSAASLFQEIENFFVVNGDDLSFLAAQLGTTEIFEAQFKGLTNEAQAESMLQRFGLTKDNVAGSAGTIAYTFFLQEIQNGISLADTLLAASNYLTNITGRDPIFNDTGTLLENKASVAQEVSDRGVIYSDLSAKVLTVVTKDLDSVSAAKAIVSLIPTGSAAVTTAMQSNLSSIMDNVKSIAALGTAEVLKNVASYLELIGAQISTATPASLASILTAIDSVTTSALNTPTVLENPATLATSTVTSPDTIASTIDSILTVFTVIESGGAVTGFGGTATGDITLTSWTGGVDTGTLTLTRGGISDTTNTNITAGITLGTEVLVASAANLAGVTIAGASGAVTLTDTTLTAAVLVALDNTIAGTLNAATVKTMTGKVADINTVLITNAATSKGLTTTAVTVTDAATIAQLAAIDALVGTVTATTVADTAAIAASNTGSYIDTDVKVTITGTSAATVAELKAINNATTGTIALNTATIAANLTGLAADVAAAFAGITTHTGTLGTTDTTTVAQANALNAITTGVVTAAISGTPTELATLTGTTGAYALTITGGVAATIAELKAINNATTGTITLNAATIAANLTGLAADVAAAFTGITTHTGTLGTTDATTVAQANILGAATAGVVTTTVTSGTAAVLNGLTTAATDAISSTLTDTTGANLADLNAIAGKTTGTIVATSVVAVTGSVAEANTYASDTDGDFTGEANAVTLTVDEAAAGTAADQYTTINLGNFTNTITTGAAATTVVGNSGVDTITGGVGADTITGGAGADTLAGGNGEDNFVYLLTADLFTGQTTVDTSLAGGVGTDDELLIGTTGTTFAIANNDAWAGVTTVETITAVANTVAVTTALDVTAYAAGIRTVDLSLADSGANNGNVIDISEYVGTDATILTGSTAGGNTITGGAGADTITGGALVDTITGGNGIDTITGGAGVDTFVMEGIVAAVNASNVADFVDGVGGDVIQLDGAVTGLSNASAVILTSVAGKADTANFLIADTAANLGASGVSLGDNSAFTTNKLNYAFETDTGNLYYDADGNWNAGVELIGTFTGADGGLVAGNFLVG